MSRLAACLLLLASCGQGGAQIIVNPSGETAYVRLFVGVTEVAKTWMISAHPNKYPEVYAYARDDYNELDKRAVVPGEPVAFEFVGAPSDELAVVIAVGYSSADVAVSAQHTHAVKVPNDYVARYTLDLQPLSVAGTHVDTWQSPGGDRRCVVFSEGSVPGADAIVPPDDADCDDFITGDALECAPTFYKGRSGPTLDKVQCLIPDTVPGTTTDTCMLGGPLCMDGVGDVGACTAPSVVCLPSSTCAACQSSFECAKNFAEQPVPRPHHISCTIRFVNNSICNQPLAAASGSTNLGLRTCNTDPGVRITQPGATTWTERVVFQHDAGEVQIEIKNTQPDCNFEVVPSGTFSGLGEQFSGMVAGVLDNGRGVAVPIVFNLTPALTCDLPEPCTLPVIFATDTFFACINSDPFAQ